MDGNTKISRVAIVGTSLIGGSWAACFLAHGLDVVATDPATGTEDKMRQ
jgi:carnitine 3-dehydrogenase